MSAVAERYAAVLRRVRDAADRAGRDPDAVTVIAVTKTVGVQDIRNAVAAGMCDFGENRVQEFEGKYGLFPGVRWHFIGTLQTNKVKGVVGRASLIHSVDSLRLLEYIERRASEQGVPQKVLLEVDIAGEATKHGLRPDDLEDVIWAAEDMEFVEVKGFMTMAPYARPETVRWVFRELAEVRSALSALPLNRVELTELSMGMSNDFEVAVEEGSTMVRVGRAIFGR